MESVLRSLVGRKVTIYSGEQSSDEGMLDNYDDQFIVLKTNQGRYLYFVIARIRLIKPAA